MALDKLRKPALAEGEADGDAAERDGEESVGDESDTGPGAVTKALLVALVAVAVLLAIRKVRRTTD